MGDTSAPTRHRGIVLSRDPGFRGGVLASQSSGIMPRSFSPTVGFDALKITLTPLARRAGMCVLIDVVLSGLLLKSTLSSLPNPVFATNGAMSEMLLEARYSHFRLVKPLSGDTSDIELTVRLRLSRLVKFASAEMSDIALYPRNIPVSLGKPDSADTSADTSVMTVPLSPMNLRLVKPLSADLRSRCDRLTALSNWLSLKEV